MPIITSTQQKALMQFLYSALLSGSVAVAVSLTTIISQPGPIDWRQIVIYLLIALGISVLHSAGAALATTQPLLSAAIAGLLQALESHSQALQTNTEAIQAHTAIMASSQTAPEASEIKD